MCILVKFGDHRSYRNGDINYYMDTMEKAELTASIRHIAIFLKSRVPIYNFEVQDTAGRKNEMKENTGNCKALCA